MTSFIDYINNTMKYLLVHLLLAHLAKDNMSFCHHLSSVNFSHFNLLLWNPLAQWTQNLVGSIYGRSSIKNAHFVLNRLQYNTNLLLSIMTPNILSRTIKWITYIWFHIDWFDWFYNKERKKEGQYNKWINTMIKSDPAWLSYIISRYLLAHHA